LADRIDLLSPATLLSSRKHHRSKFSEGRVTMRTTPTLALALSLFAFAHVANAVELNANMIAYRDCSLKRLDACQNSNQLVWGPFGSSGKSSRKADFDKAFKLFLCGAPRIRNSGHSWSAADVALESITGPGDPPTRFPDGTRLFFGFTPHDAPDMAAVAFDTKGKIILIATLNSDSSPRANYPSEEQRLLTIYLRNQEPSPALMKTLQAWARKSTSEQYVYPGTPSNVFAGARILQAVKGSRRWEERRLS
jgi:hypothetical protein